MKLVSIATEHRWIHASSTRTHDAIHTSTIHHFSTTSIKSTYLSNTNTTGLCEFLTSLVKFHLTLLSPKQKKKIIEYLIPASMPEYDLQNIYGHSYGKHSPTQHNSTIVYDQDRWPKITKQTTKMHNTESTISTETLYLPLFVQQTKKQFRTHVMIGDSHNAFQSYLTHKTAFQDLQFCALPHPTTSQ